MLLFCSCSQQEGRRGRTAVEPPKLYSQETAAEQAVDTNDESVSNLVVPPPATDINHEVQGYDG